QAPTTLSALSVSQRSLPQSGQGSTRRPCYHKSMRVTVLGSGTSHGVPMIGCDCAVCTSTDPRDKRTRPSIVVVLPTGTILVDTAPELRLQAVANQVRRVDAVLFTHTHADHVHGIDDLRAYNARQRSAIPLYGSRASMEDIRVRFDYIFAQSYLGGGLPLLDLHPVEGPFAVLGHTVEPAYDGLTFEVEWGPAYV